MSVFDEAIHREITHFTDVFQRIGVNTKWAVVPSTFDPAQLIITLTVNEVESSAIIFTGHDVPLHLALVIVRDLIVKLIIWPLFL